MAPPNQVGETDEQREDDESLLTVASLIHWSGYNRPMGRIFYEKFGKVLEQKVGEFEQSKRELKQCVRRTLDNPKALQTPRRLKPAAEALTERINQMKGMNLDDGEEECTFVDDSIRPQEPQQDEAVKQDIAEHQPSPPNGDVTFATPDIVLVSADGTPNKAELTPKTPMANIFMEKTPHSSKPLSLQKLALLHSARNVQMPPLCDFGGNKTPSTKTPTATKLRPNLDTTLKRQQKLNEMEQKALHAQQQRELQLKDKAERAKREREKRQMRVEMKRKEVEKKERAERLNAQGQESIAKEFLAEQRKLEQCPLSPFHLGKTHKKVASSTPKKPQAKQKETTPDANKTMTLSPPSQDDVLNRTMTLTSHEDIMNKTMTLSLQKHESVVTCTAQKPKIETRDEDDTYSKETENEFEYHTMEATVDKENQCEYSSSISAYDMTKEKILMPATEENYGVDDLSSGDETDPEDEPRKQIPRWAQKETLEKHLASIRKVLTEENIEHNFGHIQQPALEDLFKNSKKKYPGRRISSATWESPVSNPTAGIGRYQSQFQPGVP